MSTKEPPPMAAAKHPTRSHTLTEDEQRAYLNADQEPWLWDDIKGLLFAELREQAKEEGVTIVLKARDGRVIETFLAPGATPELKPQTPSYTLEQIRAAFWAEFKNSGELWFPYPSISPEEDCEDATESAWQSFVEKLGAAKP